MHCTRIVQYSTVKLNTKKLFQKYVTFEFSHHLLYFFSASSSGDFSLHVSVCHGEETLTRKRLSLLGRVDNEGLLPCIIFNQWSVGVSVGVSVWMYQCECVYVGVSMWVVVSVW